MKTSMVKEMELPRTVIVGPGVIERSAGIIDRLVHPKIGVIVCDAVTKRVAGDRVSELLADCGHEIEMLVIDEADAVTVDKVISASGHSAFLVGIGGGRPIDVAKVSSHRLSIPFISIPTSASHDGIASGRASILVEGKKTSLEARPPIAVIADTEIISKSPHRLLSSGCGDVISNKTAVLDWRLASRIKGEYLSRYAAALSEMSADIIVDNAAVIKPGSVEGAKILVKALVSSGVSMSIAGSSRPASGAEHLFSHALDRIAKSPALHGEQCGVGSIITMYLHGGDWRKIKNALLEVGAPVDADGLGIEPETILDALTLAHTIRPERYTILNGGLSREAAEKACRATGVISD